MLGSYLEAVCVDGLDGVAELLGSFDGGQLAVVTGGAEVGEAAATGSLRAKVQGATVLGSLLSSVFARRDAAGGARAPPRSACRSNRS